MHGLWRNGQSSIARGSGMESCAFRIFQAGPQTVSSGVTPGKFKKILRSPGILMRGKHSALRQIWLKVHWYLAFAFGIAFCVMGLSGSLSIYGETLDRCLNWDLIVEKPSASYQSLDRIMTSIRATHPQRRGAWTLEMPRTPESMLTAWYENPSETAGRWYAPLMVSVDPYTAEVVASRFWGETAITWVRDLHTQLQLGRSGWKAVGWLGLALIVSIVSGFYLWWPGLTKLRGAFGWRHDLGIGRLFLDSHRLLGFFAGMALLILAFTGVNLTFPEVSEALVGASDMGHGDDGPRLRSTAVPNDRPVGLDEAVLLARGPFPHAEVRRVSTPAGPTGTYRISLWQRSEINRLHPMTTVWVDQYSGQIRAVRNPLRFTTGETVLSWLWPLHTGEALGKWGRLVWFLAGLTPSLLFATGLLCWLVRRGWVRDLDVVLPSIREPLWGFMHGAVRIGGNTCRVLHLYALRIGRGFIRGANRWFRERMDKPERW